MIQKISCYSLSFHRKPLKRKHDLIGTILVGVAAEFARQRSQAPQQGPTKQSSRQWQWVVKGMSKANFSAIKVH